MKFSAVALALGLIASPVLAQLSGFPDCSVACVLNAAGSGACGLADVKCQCTDGRAAIQAASTPCISKACSPEDAAKAFQAGIDLCASAGITITDGLPSATAAVAASSASGSASSSTKSSSGVTSSTTHSSSHSSSSSSSSSSNVAPIATLGAMGIVGAGALGAAALLL